MCGTSKRTLKARRYRDFVEEWEKRMSEAYSLVQERCKAAKERSEARWKKRLIATQLKVGDKVLVSNKREQGGPGKIRARWEADVFEVIEVLGEGVVYKVANLSKAKDERVLHRNLLLPCDLIEEEHPVQSKKTSVEKDTRKNRSLEQLEHPVSQNQVAQMRILMLFRNCPGQSEVITIWNVWPKTASPKQKTRSS